MIALLAAVAGLSLAVPDPNFDVAAREARDLLARLVAADTTNPPGNEARAATIGEARLREAGIPFEVTDFAPGRQNLVARLKGVGSEKPVLVYGHIDVVGTTGQSWSSPPHLLTEAGGYLVGRGSGDDLGPVAVALEALVLLAKSGIPLRRDVILAWTGDEESGGDGIRWLLDHRPASLAAGIAIDMDSGGPRLDADGKMHLFGVETAQKNYQDIALVAHGTTGHSSVPLSDNAIVRLAHALDGIDKNPEPVRLLPVTRAYLLARADGEAPELAAAMRKVARSKGALPTKALRLLETHPELAALLRTTCIPTMVNGGTRVNALPATAEANVNCRLLPDEKAEALRQWLVEVIGDPKVDVVLKDPFVPSPESPLEGEGMQAIAQAAAVVWPGSRVGPRMDTGAGDAAFLRSRGFISYGCDPLAMTDEDDRRAHGIDERIPVGSLRTGVEFLYRLLVDLAAQR